MIRWLLALFAVASSFNCGGGCEPAEDPCRSDPLGCSDGEAFVIDQTCNRIGDLVVSLGANESAPFELLPEGEFPRVYEGRQGGCHMFSTVRVFGVEETENPRIQLAIKYVADGDILASRSVTLGGKDDAPLEFIDGRVEAHGLVVFMDCPGSAENEVYRVVVTDACGRTGEDQRTSVAE